MTKNTQTTPVKPENIRPPFRTLVVDDSATFMGELCRFLATQPLIKVVGKAEQGVEAVLAVEIMNPDLVLMDLNMPIMGGLQATAILRRRRPEVRVIVMSMDDRVQAAADARGNGAHGFVGKDRITSELMAEVGRVFAPDPAKDDRSTP